MGSRSSGGINFGEAQLSQSKVASTSGLCLRKPPHAADSFTTTTGDMVAAGTDFLPKYNFHVMSGRHTIVIKTLKTCSTKRTFIQNGNADNQADICPFAIC